MGLSTSSPTPLHNSCPRLHNIRYLLTLQTHLSPIRTLVLTRPTVINWWNEYWSSAAPLSLGLLLFSSLITPLALIYLLIIPVYFTETAFYSPALIACVEGLMAFAWAGTSISTAKFISDRECFGQVCNMARAAIVLGMFQWLARTLA